MNKIKLACFAGIILLPGVIDIGLFRSHKQPVNPSFHNRL